MQNNIPKFNHEKFLSKINTSMAKECWDWTGFIDRDGYGKFHIGKLCRFTHRISYEIFIKKIDDGMVIDHICRNRRCCNPDHLREVSVKINSLENSVSITANNNVKTHCINGHELTFDNLYIYGNHRRCKACIFIRQKERRLRLKSK